MKVIATNIGYYGKIREVGEEFDVEDGLQASWFVPVDKAVSEKPKSTGKKQQGAVVEGDDADLV